MTVISYNPKITSEIPDDRRFVVIHMDGYVDCTDEIPGLSVYEYKDFHADLGWDDEWVETYINCLEVNQVAQLTDPSGTIKIVRIL